MILKVGSFKEGVVKRVETTYDPLALDLEFVDLHYSKKVGLEGLAERIKQTLVFKGTLTSRVEQTCARCLTHVERDTSMPFNLSYDVQDKETVDTTDDLRDILILDHPDRFLCNATCRGICAGCGANLNREKCRCQTHTQPIENRISI